jgi:PhnB protein
MKPENTFWGDRYGSVKDPFGHQWSFATHIKDMTPEEVAHAAEARFAKK